MNLSFSYKYFTIFGTRIVEVFSQFDVGGNFKKNSNIQMYFFKRGLAALIDVFFYAVIMKICEPILGNEINGEYYTHTGLGILCLYIIMLVQDLLFKRTIGKRLLNLQFEFLEDKNGQNEKQKLRLIFRRLFDVLEIICAFIYIIPVLVTEKRQKLGDRLSNIVVVESK